MPKITKTQLINYLVDSLGHSESTAKKIASIYYGTEYLSDKEKEECIKYNS